MMTFFIAYMQADVKTDVFVELPIRFGVGGYHKHHCIIKLNKGLYGLKYTGLTSIEHIKGVLEARGFIQYNIDPCVWYQEWLVLFMYMD